MNTSISDCKNKYASLEEIRRKFGSDEAQKKCNKCPHCVSDGGLITCELLNEE